jgi:hypothetical protein
MDILEAVDIINFNKNSTKEQTLEAHKIFFKTYFNVNIENEDGTYKNMFQIFEESYNNLKGEENE